MPAKILAIPLSRQAALRLLRKTATDASRVNILASVHEGPWRKVIDYRQIILCLTEGSLVREPSKDEHGNTIFILERYSAGSTVQVTAALVMPANAERNIVVTEYSATELSINDD